MLSFLSCIFINYGCLFPFTWYLNIWCPLRVIPMIEAREMAVNTWLTSNLMVLCHSVGKEVLMDFTMYWRFIYFATVLRPEYFWMLLPVNLAMDELYFVFFICKVMVFCWYFYVNALDISKIHPFSRFLFYIFKYHCMMRLRSAFKYSNTGSLRFSPIQTWFVLLEYRNKFNLIPGINTSLWTEWPDNQLPNE